MGAIYATITIELSSDGMIIKCDEAEKTAYIKKNINGNTDIRPLVDFINEVEDYMDPDVTYKITEKGEKYLKELQKLQEKKNN